MKCQTCLKKNDPGCRFCRFCGSLLEILVCKRCSFTNYLRDRFCGGCGLDLQKGSIDEKDGAAPSPEEKIDQMKYSLKDVMFDIVMDMEKERDSKSRKLDKIDQDTIKKLFKKKAKK